MMTERPDGGVSEDVALLLQSIEQSKPNNKEGCIIQISVGGDRRFHFFSD
jgi:hypothetical protein